MVKESVCGKNRREVVEGCAYGHERVRRHDEAVVGSGRGRSLREETVRLGGPVHHVFDVDVDLEKLAESASGSSS